MLIVHYVRTFFTQDTYKGSPWQPWTQNLYTYVGNNPINYVDPTGHEEEEVITMPGLAGGGPGPTEGGGPGGEPPVMPPSISGPAVPTAVVDAAAGEGVGHLDVTGVTPEEFNALAPAPSSWGNPSTLTDHFDRHGGDFGATTQEQYANMAKDFFNNRADYQVKVDSKGVIRVYDPNTNTFGSYNADGTTKTFFKPTESGYFDNQPGS